MIAKLTGQVDSLGESFLILDVNGVGYLLSCSSRTLSNCGAIGESITLFVETVMRQESLQLYGFGTKEERDTFRLLTTVQGVGMRMALSLLSALSPAEIFQAVEAQDKTLLTRAEGVGPKLANRMITELKDKVPTELGYGVHVTPSSSSTDPLLEEAASALVNLGYRRPEIMIALTKAQKNLPANFDLQGLIRQGLSHLSQRAS